MTKIIADISGNHGGSLDKAMDLIRAAADCGCDYAKFQYYDPELMPDQENRALYDNLRVPRDWLVQLFGTATKAHIPFFASVFDIDGVLELEDWNVPFFKIASPESTRLNNYKEIIGQIRRRTPIIFSVSGTDYAPFGQWMGKKDIVLYCPEGHPAPPRNFPYGFDGLSDHCADLTNSRLALEREAKWIERHIKLDDDCIDAAFSSNPKEMAELCRLAHE